MMEQRFSILVAGEMIDDHLILDSDMLEVIDSESGKIIKTVHPGEFLKTAHGAHPIERKRT
jgi:hypothetical protein